MNNTRLNEYVKATEMAQLLLVHEKGASTYYIIVCNDMGYVFDDLADLIENEVDPMINVDDFIKLPNGATVALCTAEEGYGVPDDSDEAIHGYRAALTECERYTA